MVNPIGFSFHTIRCAWIITDTQAKAVEKIKIEVSSDWEYQHIVYVKEGKELNSAGERLDMKAAPRSRYYIRVQAMGDNGEKAVSTETAFFETGKMKEPWKAQWLKPQCGDRFHPVFIKEFQTTKKAVKAGLYISVTIIRNASTRPMISQVKYIKTTESKLCWAMAGIKENSGLPIWIRITEVNFR